MRKRFEKTGRSTTIYARVNGFSRQMLENVLDEKIDGSKNSKKGVTRKIIMQLKSDGVFIGKVAWE